MKQSAAYRRLMLAVEDYERTHVGASLRMQALRSVASAMLVRLPVTESDVERITRTLMNAEDEWFELRHWLVAAESQNAKGFGLSAFSIISELVRPDLSPVPAAIDRWRDLIERYKGGDHRYAPKTIAQKKIYELLGR